MIRTRKEEDLLGKKVNVMNILLFLSTVIAFCFIGVVGAALIKYLFF